MDPLAAEPEREPLRVPAGRGVQLPAVHHRLHGVLVPVGEGQPRRVQGPALLADGSGQPARAQRDRVDGGELPVRRGRQPGEREQRPRLVDVHRERERKREPDQADRSALGDELVARPRLVAAVLRPERHRDRLQDLLLSRARGLLRIRGAGVQG